MLLESSWQGGVTVSAKIKRIILQKCPILGRPDVLTMFKVKPHYDITC